MAQYLFIPLIVPEVDVFLTLSPEEVGGVILEHLHALEAKERRGINRHNFSMPNILNGYPDSKLDDCQKILMEGWNFLEREGFLAPRPADQYPNYFLTRKGEQVRNRAELASFIHSALLPKDLLHEQILNRAYPLFVRANYETAVFEAYKSVEVAVRLASRSSSTDLGVALMQKAFHPDNGPLTDLNEPSAERQALMFLFSGAVGRFKNPSSHRHLAFNEPKEAVELLLFASHLLRVVEDRAPK